MFLYAVLLRRGHDGIGILPAVIMIGVPEIFLHGILHIGLKVLPALVFLCTISPIPLVTSDLLLVFPDLGIVCRLYGCNLLLRNGFREDIHEWCLSLTGLEMQS